MSSQFAPQDSVVSSSDQMAQGGYMQFQHGDGSSLSHQAEASPTSLPGFGPYPHQDGAQADIIEGTSDYQQSTDSRQEWNTFFGTPSRAAATPRVAIDNVLHPPRRRVQKPRAPVNVRAAPLPNQSIVADGQRSISNPEPRSHVYSASGTIEAPGHEHASVPRYVPCPSAQGHAATRDYMTDELPVASGGLNSNEHQPLDDQGPTRGQYAVKDNIPGLGITEWSPPNGQEDGLLQEGGSRKRSREEPDLHHVEASVLTDEYIENLLKELEEPSLLGLEVGQSSEFEAHNRAEALPWGANNVGEAHHRPEALRWEANDDGEAHHRPGALRWDDDDVDEIPRSKRLRHGNGNASFVHNNSPEHEDGSSAISRQSVGPDAARIPRANLRPQRINRTVKKRISRSVKQRSHGDLVAHPDGTYLFREHGKDNWEPTAYHEDMRGEMIAEMYSYGEYDNPPTSGPDPNDQTAFEPTQMEWAFNGHQGWGASQDSLMYRFERRDHRDPNYEPGPLRFGGYVVLNKNHEVITGWRDMPLTISSSIEGGRIENIQRLDSRIAVEDFMDRMPSRVLGKPVQGRSAFTNRTMRYRLENGLASWQPRDGSVVIKNIMLRHLTTYQLQNNTTKGYAGLTEAEKAEIKNNNARTGKYRSRAGKNALPRI